jgi:hypothetical protein
MADDLIGKITGLSGIAILIILLGIFAVFVAVYYNLFAMIFIIIIYETLVSLDLSGSLRTIASAMLNTAGVGQSLVTLVPNPKVNKAAQRQLFSMDNPFRAMIQINRALLYFAFFAFLMTSPLIINVFNMPSEVNYYIFNFINNIVGLEVLAISVLMVLVIISNFIDIIEIVVS